MGTWGYGPFENDGAGDLIAELRAGSFDIDSYAGRADDEYLEADDAQAALALAEVLAADLGLVSAPELDGVDVAGFVGSLTTSQRTWIVTTLERTIVDGESSELYELWAENGPEDLETWRAPIRVRLDSLRGVHRT